MNQAHTVKLQAHLAHLGIASRRKAEKMIEEGKIQVNDMPAHIGQRINPNQDQIKVEGKSLELQPEELIYFLIDKPLGVVSTTSDELKRKTVMSLIPPQKQRLYPVGRLDIDSHGLMLLTNDGELTNKLTHPSFQIKKTYHVLIQGAPTNSALNHLQSGVRLKDGYTQPATVSVLKHDRGNTWLEISIHEGRNRQIRRMTERVGYPTLELKRVQMGPFNLDMTKGRTYLKLSDKEISQFKKEINS